MKLQSIRKRLWRNRKNERCYITFVFSLNQFQDKSLRHVVRDIMKEHSWYKGEWKFVENGKLYYRHAANSIKKTVLNLKRQHVQVKLMI